MNKATRWFHIRIGMARISASVMLAACAVAATAGAPTSSSWTVVPNKMADSRWAPAGCVLVDGNRALIAGGYSYDTDRCVGTADLFTEATGEFTHCAGHMAFPRDFASASLLPDGRVLIVGGFNTVLGSLATAEIYDPATDRFRVAASQMSSGRELFSATTLGDGSILFVGGFDTHSGHTLATADIFDPKTMAFHAVPEVLSQDRFGQTAVLLRDGRVLIVGGKHWVVGEPDQPLDSAEIYDPATGDFHPAAGRMSMPRDRPTATLLADGSVLIAGGQNGGDGPLTCELFDPATETFRPIPAGLRTGRMAHGAVTLATGDIALAGGWSPAAHATTNTVELYSPASLAFTEGPAMPWDMHDFAFLTFADGLVIEAGGKQVRGGKESSLASGAVWRP